MHNLHQGKIGKWMYLPMWLGETVKLHGLLQSACVLKDLQVLWSLSVYTWDSMSPRSPVYLWALCQTLTTDCMFWCTAALDLLEAYGVKMMEKIEWQISTSTLTRSARVFRTREKFKNGIRHWYTSNVIFCKNTNKHNSGETVLWSWKNFQECKQLMNS